MENTNTLTATQLFCLKDFCEGADCMGYAKLVSEISPLQQGGALAQIGWCLDMPMADSDLLVIINASRGTATPKQAERVAELATIALGHINDMLPCGYWAIGCADGYMVVKTAMLFVPSDAFAV